MHCVLSIFQLFFNSFQKGAQFMKMVNLFLILAAIGVSSCERENSMPTPSSDQMATQTQKSATDKTKIVAKVNGRPIYEDELNRKTLRDVITNEILYERGLKQGLDQKFENQIEDFKKKIIVDHVMRELSSKIPKKNVSAEEIEKYYEDNESKYTYIRAEEISVEDKLTADEIHKKAISGEDFEKLKSEYSKNGVRVNLRNARLTTRHNASFDNISVGEISDILPEVNRFKILKIVEIKKLPLSSQRIAESIKHAIISQKQSEGIRQMAEKIKDEDNIKVDILVKEK